MAASGWKGSIQFGPMLQFGVQAKAADKETVFRFNSHHANCGGRLRMQLPVCEADGQIVEKEEVVRGFNGAWPVDESYLDSLELEKSSVMTLDGLVPAEQIEPRWYKRSYDVTPEKGAERPYVLFLKLLERTGRVAIGKVVMGGKEQIVTLRPRDGIVAMELMWWPDELKANADAHAAVAGVQISDGELAMALQLGKFMEASFDPTKYANQYAAAVATYLEQLQAGKAPTPIVARASVQATTMTLEQQLAAAIAAMGGKVEAQVAAKTGRKAKVA